MFVRFPVISIISQIFRQITKPISQGIVNYAATRPIFRHYCLLMPGRIYYKTEANLKLLKKTKTLTDEKKTLVVNDEKAIKLGSMLMIEVRVQISLSFTLQFHLSSRCNCNVSRSSVKNNL
jgi:uncharacterized membrane protein YjjB (DUF3815 family)